MSEQQTVFGFLRERQGLMPFAWEIIWLNLGAVLWYMESLLFWIVGMLLFVGGLCYSLGMSMKEKENND